MHFAVSSRWTRSPPRCRLTLIITLNAIRVLPKQYYCSKKNVPAFLWCLPALVENWTCSMYFPAARCRLSVPAESVNLCGLLIFFLLCVPVLIEANSRLMETLSKVSFGWVYSFCQWSLASSPDCSGSAQSNAGWLCLSDFPSDGRSGGILRNYSYCSECQARTKSNLRKAQIRPCSLGLIVL